MQRINNYDKCIYTTPKGLCLGSAELHPKEHYLPAGLGNFKEDVRLSNFICYDCQNLFSGYEEVFLRNSPEAFFRKVLQVRGRRSNTNKDIFVDRTAGLRPLTVRGPLPNLAYDVLWEVAPEEQLYLLNQLIFKKDNGDIEWVPIRNGRVASDLAALRYNCATWQLLFITSTDSVEQELKSVFGSILDQSFDLPARLHEGLQIPVEMRVIHSLPYIQALCKIAFHFILARFHFTGYEEEFDDLKRFIYLGTTRNPAQIVEEPLIPQLIHEDAYLREWCHVLTAEYDPNQFIARMQFFNGPKLKPFTWRIHLGRNPSLILTEEAKGFRYCYYKSVDASGYIGSVEQLRLGPKLLAHTSL